MVGEYYILLSANTPLARLTPRSLLLAHSCSHTRFARTLARTPCGGHAVYVVSLRSKSARFLWSHAGTLARLTPRSLLPTLPLVARALKRCRSAPNPHVSYGRTRGRSHGSRHAHSARTLASRAHSLHSHTRFCSTSASPRRRSCPRSFGRTGFSSGVALLQFKTPVDLSYHSY